MTDRLEAVNKEQNVVRKVHGFASVAMMSLAAVALGFVSIGLVSKTQASPDMNGLRHQIWKWALMARLASGIVGTTAGLLGLFGSGVRLWLLRWRESWWG